MSYNLNLDQIEEYNTKDYQVNPKRAALVVIEMQNVFLKDLGIISDIQMFNIQKIIAAADAVGTEVIYVRHNDNSDISK